MSRNSLGTLTLDLAVRLGSFTQGMDAAERATARSAAKMKDSFNAVKGIFAGIFAGFTVGALAGAVKEAIEFGDEIGKAADKAGIAASDMSELAFAARLADVEIGGLSTALKAMQVNLSQAGSGDKSAIGTLKALGLTIADLQQLKPDQQFERLAGAINSLRDPADKARAATELFGKAGADLLPLFAKGAEGIRQAREEAEKFGLAFSDEQIAKLQKGDDALKKLSATLDGWKASLAIATINTLEFFDVIDKDNVGELEDQLRGAQAALREATVPPNDGVFDPEIYKAAAEEVRRLTAQIENAQATYTRGGGSRRGRGPVAAPGFQAAAVDAVSPVQEIKITLPKIEMTEMEKFYEELNQSTKTQEEVALQSFYRQEVAINELFDAGIIGAEEFNARMLEIKDELVPEFEVTAKKVKEVAEKQVIELNEFQKQAARNTQDIIADTLTSGFDGGIKGIVKSFGDMLIELSAQAVAANIASKLFGEAGGGEKGTTGWLGLLAGAFTAKASGGPVSAGVPYLVGERGPEVIVPRGSGTVIPNGGMRSQMVNVNFTLPAGGEISRKTQDQGAAMVMSGLVRANRRNS